MNIAFRGQPASLFPHLGQHRGRRISVEGETKQYSIMVDPAKKPKTLDRGVAEGKSKGQTYRYLYELEGNTLRLCYDAEMNDVRPKEFKSKGTLTILTFERRKGDHP